MQNPIYFETIRGAEKLDLQDCVLYYQQSKNENVLRIILYKLRSTINYYLHIKTNYSDKAELIALYEDKLLECLDTYDSSRHAKFITFYSRCLDNALYNFLTKNNKDTSIMSLDYTYSNEDEETDSIYNYIPDEKDLSFSNVEDEMFVDSLKDNLDTNEYRFCKVVIAENHKLTAVEIAKELGLTESAIPNIVKRLRKKFLSEEFTKKFRYSV